MRTRVATYLAATSLASCPPASAPGAGAVTLVSAGGAAGGVGASASASVCSASRKVVWRGNLTRSDWLQAWDPTAKILPGDGNAEVVEDARFGRALRVHYPAGSSSSSYARTGHPAGGVSFRAALPGASHESIFFSYWLKFDPHFQWVRGGKLPGLCGGTCPSGGAEVTGIDGWSMRYMWRPGGAGEQYAYILPARPYGTELGLGSWSFSVGAWHRIAEELILNTGGSANGVSRVWYDVNPAGKPTFEETDMTYRRDATAATAVFFSTFFGGHDAKWATPTDTFIDFADLVVCE